MSDLLNHPAVQAGIERSDFGVKAVMGAVSDEVRLQLSIEAFAE